MFAKVDFIISLHDKVFSYHNTINADKGFILAYSSDIEE